MPADLHMFSMPWREKHCWAWWLSMAPSPASGSVTATGNVSASARNRNMSSERRTMIAAAAVVLAAGIALKAVPAAARATGARQDRADAIAVQLGQARALAA